jgi:hypothetical protein
MKAVILIVALLSVVSMTECRNLRAFSRNYIRNTDKAIVNSCNSEAHKQIQDDEIYDCFKNKTTDCTNLANFSEFNAIRTDCIKSKRNDVGFGIVIAIMMWVILGIFSNR